MLIGALGQLAQELAHQMAAACSFEVAPLSHAQLEITDVRAVRRAVAQIRPECIINTAAFHQVDACESAKERAFAVNVDGARNVAAAAEISGALVVQFSSDHVFDGKKKTPYVETDEAHPVSVYGQSRLAGERAAFEAGSRVLVVRTCGLYGKAGSASKGGNFVETMLRMAATDQTIKVVNDQICTPTSTRELAEKLLPLIRDRCTGLFHMTNRGECSWFEFAGEIFRLAGLPADLTPTTTAAFAAKAARPAYSVLENAAYNAAGYPEFHVWQEELARYIAARQKG